MSAIVAKEGRGKMRTVRRGVKKAEAVQFRHCHFIRTISFVSRFLHDKLAGNCHLCDDQPKNEAPENLRPELATTFKNTFIDVEVMVRPHDATERTKERTGQQN